MEREPTYRFDLREALIPFSLLRIRNTFNEMLEGEILEVVLEDPSIRSEILRLLPPSTCRITCQEAPDGESAGYCLKIVKSSSIQSAKPREEDHV